MGFRKSEEYRGTKSTDEDLVYRYEDILWKQYPDLAQHHRLRSEVTRDPKNRWLRNHRYAPQTAEMTVTQRMVAQFVACGLSDKEIAHFLGITCATVKAHNAAILRSLGLYRRAQLVRFIFESRQFDPEAAEIALELRIHGSRSRKGTG